MVDIVDDYIRTSERFRVIRLFFGVPVSYGNTGKKYWALTGLSGKERQQPGGGAPPSQAQSELDKGVGARPPLPSLSTPLLSPLLLVGLGKEETYCY